MPDNDPTDPTTNPVPAATPDPAATPEAASGSEPAAMPNPDSVRLALPKEAAVIAEVQRRGWAEQPGPLAQAMLTGVDMNQMTEAWHTAITRPPLASCRIMVAVAENRGDEPQRVVGFASLLPSDDPDADQNTDGMIQDLLIDPQVRRKGHGSRLLNAAVDTLRADGFRRATCWVTSTDDATREFLTGAGWAADGSHREIGDEDESVRIKQVRLHTDITGD